MANSPSLVHRSSLRPLIFNFTLKYPYLAHFYYLYMHIFLRVLGHSPRFHIRELGPRSNSAGEKEDNVELKLLGCTANTSSYFIILQGMILLRIETSQRVLYFIRDDASRARTAIKFLRVPRKRLPEGLNITIGCYH